MPESHDVVATRYELAEMLARGGMATVWRARDTVLARTVAVKILHRHLADDAGFLERFRREALAAASLTHPHIVSIYDTGEDQTAGETCHYIVMEHCGGGTLAALLRREGPFPPDRVVSVGATVCEALEYAHSNGIVHRDVKPANVLVGDDGLLKVGDFGIAKAASEKSDITTTGTILGTVAYISPEYATDRELDARSDIYSLGIVLYELAVGRPPFVEETSMGTAMKHLNETPPRPRTLRAGISRTLESVILTALEKDPDARFGSARELRDALVAATGGTAPTHAIVAPGPPPRARAEAATSFRSESRWIGPVLALVVAALVLAAVAAAVFEDAPGGGRGPGERGGEAAALEIATVRDFDPEPEGDGEEDEFGLRAVNDGDETTTWTTDIYDDPLHLLKPGVGVLLDLGSTHAVDRVEVVTPDSDLDLELWASDERPDTLEDLTQIDTRSGASGTVTFEAGSEGRYWLVWITDLPEGGGGSASIAEVRLFGS